VNTIAEIVMWSSQPSPEAVIGIDEDGAVCMIEAVLDSDDRPYIIEIRSTPDGAHAVAYCRSNPWSESVNAGTTFGDAHVDSDGLLCLGKGSTRVVQDSPFSLEFAIRRARYWCTAFSVFKETNTFPNL